MQEFQQVGHGQTLMSDAEAQDLLRLYMNKTGGAAQISTADVAEAIRIPEDQVEALLAELRATKLTASTVKPVRRRKVRDIVIACVAAIMFLAIAVGVARSVKVSSSHDNWMYAPATYIFQAGSAHRAISTHVAPVDADQQDLVTVLWREAEENLVPPTTGRVDADPAATLRGIQAQNWDAPGIQHLRFTLSAGPETFESSLPYYEGTDHQIQQKCADERRSRIESLLQEIAQKARIAQP